MNKQNVFDAISDAIDEGSFTEQDKNILLRNLTRIKDTKINILITGATGSGKSSTINALFQANKAKVGMGSDPETMDIEKYELDNIILYDSPGLGDGKEADRRHAKRIIELLHKKDSEGELLIDLVLVILDGGSRDLGTSYELINEVIIPNLGKDKSRLLIAINQCDMAMKGRGWNYEKNEPMPELITFLDEKVISTKRRIFDATGVNVDPIYYSAGYQDEFGTQRPYNLSKLLLFILRHTKEEKRAAFISDINQNKQMWEKDDQLENYREEISSTIWGSVAKGASKGAQLGATLGATIAGPVGAKIGGVVGGVVGAIGGLLGLF